MISNTYDPPARAVPLYAAILEEVVGQNWSQPVQAIVDELGLVMGTHLGLKRTRNEDRLAVARIRAPNAEIYTVALVCDGVGGSESGDHAAAIAISSVVYQLAIQKGRPSLKELATALVRCADDHVRQELQGRGATTLVMMLATSKGLIVCAGVGDSRVYDWDVQVGKLRQLTTDDTIENELKDVPGNHTALLQARGLKGRLSQAIGETGRTSEELRVQTYTREFLSSGALLGSDGLWRVAGDFETIAAESKNAVDLVRRAINLANWVGGVDNASLIAVKDLECFCYPSVDSKSSTDRNASITLWISSSKIRLIPVEWQNSSGTSETHSSLEKNKKKSVKTKSPGKKISDPQLSLEPESLPDKRPKIEVTIIEEPKKSR